MKALAFGEVLWDVFPGGKKLGGAPMNFCAHLAKLGDEAFILTAVGADENGEGVLDAAHDLGINKSFIAISSEHPTGVCNVSFDKNNEPSYQLADHVAYDYIKADDEMIRQINQHEFDIFYFGTVAQRSEASRTALEKILENCRMKDIFCDINLRDGLYDKGVIMTCLKHATLLKLNRSECAILSQMRLIGKSDNYQLLCHELCEKYNIKLIILTMDADGAMVYNFEEDKLYHSGKPKNQLVSAVGAGDSFSACFLYNYTKGVDLQSCIDRANILGDYVVGFDEAVPEYSAELIRLIK